MPTPTVDNFVKSGALSVLYDIANNLVQRAPIYSITLLAGTATIIAYSHGLTTGTFDIIGLADAAYNGTGLALTVVDADTLTYAVAGAPVSPAVITGAGAWILDPNYSNVATGVSAVQVETPGAATTLQIQKRLHPSGSWIQDGADITNASAPVIVSYTPAVPMLRIKRSAGTGVGKAFWQKGPD